MNVVLSVTEYVGPSTPDELSIANFASFLVQGSFHELPVSGGLFTWMGMRSAGRVWKKLDRLLFNDSWLITFPGSSISLLSRLTSDHSPLLLQVDFNQYAGPRPFRFQHMWLQRQGFLDVMD